MTATLLTAFLFLLLYLALIDLVLELRRSHLAGALAPALACFVALEAVVLNGLSLFSLVDRFWLTTVHLSLLVVWLLRSVHRGRLLPLLRRCISLGHRLVRRRAVQILLPLIILLTLTAILYPPNTYDVLTYHMARVVHWMQNGSVAYYPTAIERQNVMGPGAEYLLLFLQLLSGGDSLATLLQLSSFVILIVTLLHLLRLLKVQEKLGGWITILSVTAPIAIMEASGAKNDLVATVMAFAVILSGIRFVLGRMGKMTLREYGLAGICFGSAFLVKPTALLLAVPLLSVGLVIQVPRRIRGLSWRPFILGVLVFLVAFLAVAGPDILRKHYGAAPRSEVYPLLSDYSVDRLWNPLRHLAHNTPFPKATLSLARTMGYRGQLITKDVFNLQEDMIGNPFQASALVITALMSLLLWLALFWRSRQGYLLLLSLSPLLAWCAFGLVIKDQAWLTRLQMPLFYALPFSFLYLSRIGGQSKMGGRVLYAAVAVAALASLAYATLVANHVAPRTLVPAHFWGERPGRIGAYYTNIKPLKADHDRFLERVAMSGCRRVGLIFGPDSVDYPLSWRAMEAGVEVRFLRSPVREGDEFVWRYSEQDADWPCMLYASYGVVEHVPNRGKQYLSGGDYHTYYRNLPWEFAQSSQTRLLLSSVGDGAGEERPHFFDGSAGELVLGPQRGTKGIRLLAQSHDPQLILPVFVSATSTSLIVRVRIESPVSSEVQLYYMTKTSPYYTEQNSVRVKSITGENELYFFLPGDDIVGSVRLDPGSLPGVYLLRQIEIRTVRPSPSKSEKKSK